MKKHATLSASSANRWINCPGSVKLSEGLPRPKTSRYAAEGTAAHQLAEQVLTGKLDNASDLLDKHITVAPYQITVTQEMVDAVNFYRNELKPFIIASQSGEAKLLIEERVNLNELYDGMFGTCDAIAYIPKTKTLRIFDLKYGKGIQVSAYQNPQLRYYALGAMLRFNINEDDDWTIMMTIIQPRSRDIKIQTDLLKSKDLYNWANTTLIPHAIKTKAKHAKLNLGDWCRFCPAKQRCHLQQAKEVEALKEAFKTPLLPEPSELKPEELSQILNDGRRWLSACQRLALTKAQNRETIPGFELTTKFGNRRWVSEERVYEELEPIYGDTIFDRKLKSPAQLEKVLSKELIATLTERPESGPMLKAIKQEVSLSEAFHQQNQ